MNIEKYEIDVLRFVVNMIDVSSRWCRRLEKWQRQHNRKCLRANPRREKQIDTFPTSNRNISWPENGKWAKQEVDDEIMNLFLDLLQLPILILRIYLGLMKLICCLGFQIKALHLPFFRSSVQQQQLRDNFSTF